MLKLIQGHPIASMQAVGTVIYLISPEVQTRLINVIKSIGQ
jgi:hypothetical protein